MGTNARLFATRQVTTPTCPLCKNEEERISHVLHCPCLESKKGKKAALETLDLYLDECGSHPDITLLLLLLVKSDKDLPAAVCRESGGDFIRILDTQAKICWGLVKYGFLSTDWKATQHNWLRHRDPNHNNNKTGRWARRVQTALWKYVLTIWEHRNYAVHGKTQEEVAQKQLAELQRQASNIMESPSELGPHGRLLGIHDIDKKRGMYLHHWIRAVKEATAQEQTQRKKEERSSIIQHMSNVRQRQRDQPTCRLHQVGMSNFLQWRVPPGRPPLPQADILPSILRYICTKNLCILAQYKLPNLDEDDLIDK